MEKHPKRLKSRFSVRRRPKTLVAVLAAVEVELEGRRTTGWLEKKVELISVPL